MSDNNIEELLRNSKPVVEDNPSFLLESLQKMEAVEGIKGEVDRQRRHGRTVIFVALIMGLLAGIVTTAIPLLFPETVSALTKALRDTVTASAILAVTLGLILPLGRRRHLL